MKQYKIWNRENRKRWMKVGNSQTDVKVDKNLK